MVARADGRLPRQPGWRPDRAIDTRVILTVSLAGDRLRARSCQPRGVTRFFGMAVVEWVRLLQRSALPVFHERVAVREA
jgi:hypothetical protein